MSQCPATTPIKIRDHCVDLAIRQPNSIIYGTLGVKLFTEMLIGKPFSDRELVFVKELFSELRGSKNSRRVINAIDQLLRSEPLSEFKKRVLQAMKNISFRRSVVPHRVKITIPSNFIEHDEFGYLLSCFSKMTELRLHVINPSRSKKIHWTELLDYLIENKGDYTLPKIQILLFHNTMNPETWKALSRILKDPQCPIEALKGHPDPVTEGPESRFSPYCHPWGPIKMDLESFSFLTTALKKNRSIKYLRSPHIEVGVREDQLQKASRLVAEFDRLKVKKNEEDVTPCLIRVIHPNNPPRESLSLRVFSVVRSIFKRWLP